MATSLCCVVGARADNGLRGDVNGDGQLTMADADALVNYLTGDGTIRFGTQAYVNLGLPSGTLWATTNVGASSPQSSGDFFAWGETQSKWEYNLSTYQHCYGEWNTLNKYCNSY